jgi:hypothetical protein
VLTSDLVKSLVDRLRAWQSFHKQISNMDLHGKTLIFFRTQNVVETLLDDLHSAVKKEYATPKSDDVPGWFYVVLLLNCLGILCFHLVSVIWVMRYG